MSDPSPLDRYRFELPEGLIAQTPAPTRREARLLHWPVAGELKHRYVRDLPDLVGPGDVMVVNDTRVFPARLLGTKVDGQAAVEILLVAPLSDHQWWAMVRPGRRLADGARVRVVDVELTVGDSDDEGLRRVSFPKEHSVLEFAQAHGHMPLPPYIDRPDSAEDHERYQTVYANQVGSVAAPTAGLHFDRDLLGAIEAAGASVVSLTLHVGPGTFRPPSEAQLQEGRLHRERVEISAETLHTVRHAERVIAVGTTTCRALESVGPDQDSFFGSTELFVRPGYRFHTVDVLMTNFHLPGSSLLMLVDAFAGSRWEEAYRVAITQGYRFYSYGDANWIERDV